MSIARYEFYDNIGSMYELCSYYDSGFIMNELCSYISYMTFIMIPRAQTPSVNVLPLILLFPQVPIRQKGSNLMVTVRIPEVSELLKGSDF